MSQAPKVWKLSRKRVPLVAAIVLLAVCWPIRNDVLGAPGQQAVVAATSASSSQTADPEMSSELRGYDGPRWGWWRNHMRTSSPTSTAEATTAPQGSTSASATLSSSSPSSTTSTSTTKTTTSPTGTVATLAGWPNSGNTGVPAGVTLTTYSGPMRITQPNLVIDAKIINGTLTIATTGVQIKRSKVNGTVTNEDSQVAGQTNFVLSDSEVAAPLTGVRGVTGGFFTVLRTEITGGNSGGWCSDCTIQDSYIHGQYNTQGEGYHESGYRMDQRTRLIHNAIACDAVEGPNDGGCSAALTGYGDFQPVVDNLVDSNLFLPSQHAAFCAYGGSSGGKPYSNQTRGIVFTNNVFSRGQNGKCAAYGAITDFNAGLPGNRWENNRWDDGTAVTPD
jgi:hypothetical protein